MRKIFFIFFYLFILSNTLVLKADQVQIIEKVGTDIITNIDIENEYKYLIALNTNYKSIDKKKIYNYSKESLIKEKIKKNELEKYFELGVKDTYLDQKIQDIHKRIGIKDLNEFKIYLQNYNLKIEDIYKKIEIEVKWNKLIFDKYKNQIVINEENLKKKLLEDIEDKYSYNISELVFSTQNKSDFEEKYKKIKESISNIGFEKTALIYSISDSIENSGNLGWIDEISLSEIILNEIKKIEISEITKPIKIQNGIIILKLNDKKKIIKNNKNTNDELLKLVNFERNRQLNIFSSIYFNKIKELVYTNES